MNRKINTLCFIFLFFFLIAAVSAAECENETPKTLSQSDTGENIDGQMLKASNSEKNSTGTPIKQSVTLKVPNTTIYYNDGYKLKVTLTDKNKKPIANVKLKIFINGKGYSTFTNANGIGQLKLHLKSNKYSVTTIFDGTDIYENASAKGNIKLKSTITGGDSTKYYKNKTTYSSKFYDAKGKVLKNTLVKFKINSKTYYSKTDSNGIARLNANLKPGKYSVKIFNPKTSQTVTRTLTIKSLIVTKNLVMNESDGSRFNVKILTSTGKASSNKQVILKLDGKTYKKTTNKKGEINLPIDLEYGKYTITTEYAGLKTSNKITINKVIRTSSFKHVTSIADYVNVTLPYVYPNAKYFLETGANGTVKMPKIEIFTVSIATRTYQFATGKTSSGDAVRMEEKSYLVPSDGSCLVCSKNKNSLSGDGIMITKTAGATEIEYRSKTGDNVELFGFYADKGTDNSEIFTYMQNGRIVAKVSVQTQYFDETGVRYSLARHYNRPSTDFAYYEITDHVPDPVRFTNTGKPVTYNYFGRSIVGYASMEEVTTKFIINGNEELEKKESISYGLGEKYRRAYGFEVLQAYTIITEKITQKTLEDWISMNSSYLNRFGVMNAYGMHLLSLETAWLADELANKYAKEFKVTWKRDSALTILGGINMDDTYLNILNADMGMLVKGSKNNAVQFRLLNSMNLPNIEEYVLAPISERYKGNATNSLDNVLSSIDKKEFSIAQLGDLLYVFSKDSSAIILNCTSGVASVILCKDNSTYKGSVIFTRNDCCSVGMIPQDSMAGIRISIETFTSGINELTDNLNNIHPLSVLAYMGIKFLLEHMLDGASSASLGLISAMALIQNGGTMYRNNMVDEKEWHKVMDTITFTRPGYLQGKKVYNIPNKKGGYDYVEVKINADLSLNRTNAVYISEGKTKLLSKKETYQYFSEDYWTPFSMPAKYWDNSWKGL